MRTRHLAFVAVLVAVGLVAAGCGSKKSSSSSTPPPATTTGETTTSGSASGGAALDGTVGPGFDIALTQNGQPVTTLKPGTYTLEVDDQADTHNFHLTGPGVDVTTGVSEQGVKTFTITLAAGKYHYQCDPHSSSLNGDFEVA